MGQRLARHDPAERSPPWACDDASPPPPTRRSPAGEGPSGGREAEDVAHRGGEPGAPLSDLLSSVRTDTFPAQHPVLMAVLWSIATIGVCAPVANRLLQQRTID
jgi:hypothetical protein